MDKQAFEEWSKTRQKGKWRFVLLNGVLAWGLPIYIIMTFVVGDGINSEHFVRRAWTGALIWPLAGLCFGFALWVFTERKYRRAKQQKQPEQAKDAK